MVGPDNQWLAPNYLYSFYYEPVFIVSWLPKLLLSWEGLLLNMTDISTSCAEVNFRVKDDFHWAGCWNTVASNNSPSQDYSNPDDQPTTNIDSPGSYPTIVLLRTTATWTINQQQTLIHQGSQPSTVLLRTTATWRINQQQTLIHQGHNHQQSFSGLQQPRQSTNNKHWFTWVTTINSSSQDYSNQDD